MIHETRRRVRVFGISKERRVIIFSAKQKTASAITEHESVGVRHLYKPH